MSTDARKPASTQAVEGQSARAAVCSAAMCSHSAGELHLGVECGAFVESMLLQVSRGVQRAHRVYDIELSCCGLQQESAEVRLQLQGLAACSSGLLRCG